jgi:hypothetical protein
MADRVDARWQMVTCSGCDAHYQCTPERDYFESTTLTDGLCWDCFMRAKGMPPQPEPSPLPPGARP